MKLLRTVLAVASLLVISTSTLSAQAGGVACMDGSKSVGGRGACSGHGGIRTAARKAEVKADAKAARREAKADARAAKVDAKADARAAKVEARADKKAAKAEVKQDAKEDRDARGATAECKDHTYSHARSHQGACSRHGGVARFLDGK